MNSTRCGRDAPETTLTSWTDFGTTFRLLQYASTPCTPVIAVSVSASGFVGFLLIDDLLWLYGHMHDLRCGAVCETIVCETSSVVEHLAHEDEAD